MQQEKNIQLTSSRKFVIRDINALFAPISRIKTLRDDEGRSKNVGQSLPRRVFMRGIPDNRSCFCPPCGESVPLGAKGGLIKRAFFAPPSALQATSCAREEGNSGFTLIELLVVVLIIGILAAIALPQYQLAVARTRLKGMIPLIKAVFIANQVYYLANGSYTNDITALDLSLPNVKEIKDINLTRKQITFTNGSYLLIQGESDHASVPFVSGHVPNIPAYLHRFYDPTKNWRCYATKERGTGICKAFGCEGDVPVNEGGCALPTIK